MENCCSEFPASVFCSSFSIALLQRHRYYYSIALSPPTKCLPQNLPLSICSPLGKEMEEKKGTIKRTRGREGGRQREREKPPTGMSDQSQLPAKATHSSGPDPQSLPADKCKRSLIHAHTHTITVSAHVYHIAAYVKANCGDSPTHSLSRHREVPGAKLE